MDLFLKAEALDFVEVLPRLLGLHIVACHAYYVLIRFVCCSVECQGRLARHNFDFVLLWEEFPFKRIRDIGIEFDREHPLPRNWLCSLFVIYVIFFDGASKARFLAENSI